MENSEHIKVQVLQEFSGLIEVRNKFGSLILSPEELPKLIDKLKGAAQKIQDLRASGKLPRPKEKQ
jgi:hypothetical protein